MFLPHAFHLVYKHVSLLLQDDVHIDFCYCCIVALVPPIARPNKRIVVATVAASSCVDEDADELVRWGRRSIRLGHALVDIELKWEGHVLAESDLLAVYVPSEALQMTDEDSRSRRKAKSLGNYLSLLAFATVYQVVLVECFGLGEMPKSFGEIGY